MEVIQDELQKNNVRIGIETLTEHMGYILENYKDSYTHAVERLTREELLLGRFSRNGCKQSRACHGLLNTYLPHESQDQRRYGMSSCSFSCTRDKKYRKSRREFYTRTLCVGSFVGVELMGFAIVCK